MSNSCVKIARQQVKVNKYKKIVTQFVKIAAASILEQAQHLVHLDKSNNIKNYTIAKNIMNAEMGLGILKSSIFSNITTTTASSKAGRQIGGNNAKKQRRHQFSKICINKTKKQMIQLSEKN